MLCNRLRQFREYNNLDCKLLADVLGITEEEYKDFESNKTAPTIDIIETLAVFYKVTIDEFYGNTPRFALHSEENSIVFDEVDKNTLKMADLSWDEARLILYYRKHKGDKDEIIKKILEEDE